MGKQLVWRGTCYWSLAQCFSKW